MTLKLTHQQAEALNMLFINKVSKEKPRTPDDRLIIILMRRIYQKLRTKLEGKPGSGYSLVLSDEEAHAYWIYFRDADMYLYPYESNFIQIQINQLDRQYA